jgi:hypothetical protein
MTRNILTFEKRFRSNADIIVDCHELGYLSHRMLIFDATYGKGRFWNKWLPSYLHTNDLFVHTEDVMSHFDYRDLPFASNWFGAVVYDPAYKLNGTGGSHESDADYGAATPYQNIDEMIAGINQGFDECYRVLQPGGHLLYKTMEQVVCGKRRWLAKEQWMRTQAPSRHGAPELVDELYLYGYRTQPHRTKKCKACDGTGISCDDCDGTGRIESRQQHAHQSLSVMQVYWKGM